MNFYAVLHHPRVYRYVVAEPGLRLVRNRYGTILIGLVLVVGRYAYCIKWADARLAS